MLKRISIGFFGIGLLWLWNVIGIVPLAPVQAELVDRIVAVVNDDIILLTEYNSACHQFQRDLLRKQGRSDFDPSLVLSTAQRQGILDQLINNRLTLQQVSRLGIKVSNEEINATIERVKKINKLSEEAFARTLELQGTTFEAFKADIKDQLLQNRLVTFEVKSKVVITDEDVKAYYDAKQAEYKGQTRYHLRHIFFKCPSDAPEIEKNRIFEQIRSIHNRLLSGEDFLGLADLYAPAPSAGDGGDLGFFELRLLAPQIHSALSGLAEGEFSDVIITEQGYQIIYVEEIQNVAGRTMVDMASTIEEKLYADRMDERFKTWLAELRNDAHIQIMD